MLTRVPRSAGQALRARRQGVPFLVAGLLVLPALFVGLSFIPLDSLNDWIRLIMVGFAFASPICIALGLRFFLKGKIAAGNLSGNE